MEEKVIFNRCIDSAWDYAEHSKYVQKQGSGNNWAFRYCKNGPKVLNQVDDLLRFQFERADYIDGIIITMSVAGGTGSGVGTLLSRFIRKSYHHNGNSAVANITDYIQNWLLDHWFGACTERSLDLEQSYLQLLEELGPVAVAGYLSSYMNRTAMGMTRPLHSLDTTSGNVTLQVDCFLLSGELASDLCRAMVDMNGNMDPTRSQFISVPDETCALMDEVPSRLAVLLNYLCNLGMLVTPERSTAARPARSNTSAARTMPASYGGILGCRVCRCCLPLVGALYVFPPCSFSHKLLVDSSPLLTSDYARDDFLLLILIRCYLKSIVDSHAIVSYSTSQSTFVFTCT